MVRKLIYVLAAVTALASPAFAGDSDCENCDLYRHGVHRHVVPTNDYVCLWFVQPHSSNVLLELHLKDGTMRPYTKPHAGTHGYICVGRGWLEQSTDTSFLCNDDNRFFYGLPGMIETVARKPKMSEDVRACLFGTEACAEMGYPVKRHEQ